MISIFLIGNDYSKPEWGDYWMVRPLIIVPLAGAAAGFIHYQMDGLRTQGGWKKAFALAVTTFAYFVGLWMGIILGLDGTLWN